MPVLRPHGLVGLRELGVPEGTGGHADQVRKPSRLPEDIRPASSAEPKEHRESACGGALERPAVSDGANVVPREENTNAEDAPRASLAIQAVAHGDLSRATRTMNLQVPAVAARDPVFHLAFRQSWHVPATHDG
jgi:hypothetical protein